MLKPGSVLLLALYFSCLVEQTIGFQPSPSKLPLAVTVREKNSPCSSPFQECRNLRHERNDSSRLHMFGGPGGGGLGGFGAPPDPPIETKKDALDRLQSILTGTLKQFASGLMSGYLLGSVWGLIRGPSLSGVDRGFAWGMDFGLISALFSSSNSITQFVLALGKPKSRETKQKVDLWKVVLRNVLLAVYFGRQGTYLKMARSALIYGGLTYYFVSQKDKRMNMMGGGMGGMEQLLEQLSKSQGGGMGAGMPGGTAPNGSNNAQAMANMAQLLEQLSKSGIQSGMGTTTAPPPRPPTSAQSTSSGSSSSTPKPSSPVNDKKKQDVVDVEWQKVDSDEDDDVNNAP